MQYQHIKLDMLVVYCRVNLMGEGVFFRRAGKSRNEFTPADSEVN